MAAVFATLIDPVRADVSETDSDVFIDGCGIQERILENDADFAADPTFRYLLRFHAVNQNASRLIFKESDQQIRNR